MTKGCGGMRIKGKIKKIHIAKALLGAIFWTGLSWYHYQIGVHKFVLIFMILGSISCIYDTVCVIDWYRKQQKGISPLDFI